MRTLKKLEILFLLLAFPLLLSAAEPEAAKPNEQDLIRVLRSDAPSSEKAITCKKLAVYGSDAAVPALAPLLADEQLASWALIALEAIPGPAADNALIKASETLHGRLLIGVLDSMGVRRSPVAVKALARNLNNSDPAVTSAAALALGRVGGSKAAKALARALPKAPVGARSAIAEGCIRCAEAFLAKGDNAAARRLYDRVRATDIPQERFLEATRGAILARNSAGIPLLLEQLRSSDRERFRLGLRVARELPGREATDALITEFRRTNEARQPMLLLALADRGDVAVFPLLVETLRSGSTPCRLVAVGALERSGDALSAPALLGAAADPDSQVAQAAMAALARMPGTDVDKMVLRQLRAGTGQNRQILITLAARRGDAAALPAIVTSAADPNPAVRGAALQALGALGGDREASDLVSLLQRDANPGDRSDIEAALVTLAGRLGNGCAQTLSPLTRGTEPGLRVIGLHALAAAGGPDALAGVYGATRDPDPAVQDEAVRTLSSWPNTWPDDEQVATPLLSVAKEDSKTSHQVLAVRAYLQFLQADHKMSPEAKAAGLREALPLLKRPEEQRSALAVLHGLPGPLALQVLQMLVVDSGVSDDAYSAMVSLASRNNSGLSKEARQQTLQTALEKCASEETRRRAKAALGKLE